MQALQLEKPHHFRFIEVPEPQAPGPGEAVVAVRAVGICGTDYGGFLGKMPFFSYPRIPGHELGVEVVAVGPERSTTPQELLAPQTRAVAVAVADLTPTPVQQAATAAAVLSLFALRVHTHLLTVQLHLVEHRQEPTQVAALTMLTTLSIRLAR
jgi:NADPH:quinone reductase-like Zn-dependent oxidoreductase